MAWGVDVRSILQRGWRVSASIAASLRHVVIRSRPHLADQSGASMTRSSLREPWQASNRAYSRGPNVAADKARDYHSSPRSTVSPSLMYLRGYWPAAPLHTAFTSFDSGRGGGALSATLWPAGRRLVIFGSSLVAAKQFRRRLSRPEELQWANTRWRRRRGPAQAAARSPLVTRPICKKCVHGVRRTGRS